jgi:hypothetical protein
MNRATMAVVLLGLLAPVAARAQQIASNPHGALRQGTDCSDCHTAADWKTLRRQLRFDHSKDTRFALTGKHAAVPCAGCHLDRRFDQPKVAATQCAECHVDVHRGNLAGECVRCHTTATFHDVPAVALHNRTGFPLTGAHLQTPCESCHQTERNGAYTAVARDCLACHRNALRVATTVDHSGFSGDCLQCHSPFTWQGGVNFDHATAAHGFRLEGAHASLRCLSCHVQSTSALKFSPKPASSADCFACHQPDYQRAHGNGFPTTCTDCHDVNSWASNFDHDSKFFPITSGAHRGTACATCHNTPGNFQAFTCLTCHEHSQAAMASRHAGRSGYAYDSQACYRCHSRGRGG